jgi:hypothetical protein
MHQQLWGYRVEEKLYLGVREQKTLNTTGLDQCFLNGVTQNPGVLQSDNKGFVRKFDYNMKLII